MSNQGIQTPQDRSPKYPRLDLSEALARAKKIYEQAGKSPISPETVAKVIGYSNAANGKAQAAFSALSQYGLLLRDRKANTLSVSPLAIRIFHSVSEDQKLKAIREAALNPPVFSSIHKEYAGCSETVLTSHLVQRDFTPDGAAIAAATYKANVSLAKLDSASDVAPDVSITTQSDAPQISEDASKQIAPKPATQATTMIATAQVSLGDLTLPLESGKSVIIPKMTEDDYTLFLETLQLWKRRIVIKPQTHEEPKTSE